MQYGKCVNNDIVANFTAILIDSIREAEHTVHAGDVLSIHGQTGEVFVGSRRILSAETEKTAA